MDLPADDAAFLAERGYKYTVVEEQSMLCVRLHDVPLPTGLNAESADVLLRLAAAYPASPPDMWWTLPRLTRADGSVIQATEISEVHLGLTWQRWSRHLPAGAWAPMLDGLEAFLALMHSEFDKAARKAA